MLQVRVAGVALDSLGRHVVLLKPVDALPGEGRILPIWVGEGEATSIMIALGHDAPPRPLAHDLMRAMLTALDASVEKVEITRIDAGTFYAVLTLRSPGGAHSLDSRPSDAIALATRTGSPIFVDEGVVDEAGAVDMMGAAQTEHDLEDFGKFLEDVDPDDFQE